MDNNMNKNNAENGVVLQDIDLTPIQKFYADSKILITGGTGFLGLVLLEKLLRSCPTISTIYLLIRNKKGKNVQTRLDGIFDTVIFEKLNTTHKKFRHKVVGIEGDCTLPDLGLSIIDRKLLIDEVDIVFHGAATVSFDEKLKIAIAINICGTREVLKLAQQMPKLKVFMHISTAYSNCVNTVIKEEIYPPAFQSNTIISMAENLPDKILEAITPTFVGKFPNTYTLTKQIAEDVVKQEGHGLPVGIIRPAVVISTYKEPIEGWTNNIYGPSGLVAAAGAGLIRTINCDPDCIANVVPVDMCINSVIAAAWEVATTFDQAKKENQNCDMLVYNYESSNDKPLSWRHFMNLCGQCGSKIPYSKAVWFLTVGYYKNYTVNLLAMLLLHTIPAFIADVATVCIGKKPRMLKIYSKVHKLSNLLTYFTTTDWDFLSSNIPKLINNMSDKDRQLFYCDLKELDWHDYMFKYIAGIRVYLLKDPMDTVSAARKRNKRLYWIHQITKAAVGFFFLWILWSLISLAVSCIL